ncbi:MAG TPA: glycoside hydrolase family 43 protein [Acidimicrobiales bacterium]
MGVAAVAVLVAAVATDVQAHARNRTEHRELASARSRLSVLRTDVAVTTYAKALSTNRRDGLVASVTSSLAQLAATDQQLNGTDTVAFLQGIGIGTLETCLGGVQHAYQQIALHDNGRAASDISAVATACTNLSGGSSDGLAYPFDFPDPFVLPVGGTYFAYATNSVAGNIQIIESTDLNHWSAVGDALPSLPSWVTPDETWAPSVLQIGNSFVLYYSVRMAAPGGGQECISVATATRPQGPFIDTSTGPLECQSPLGGSIDPSPFVGSDGTPYLVWKSNGGGGASALWSQQLDPAGTGFAATTAPVQLLVPDQSWEGGVIEAPDLVANGGHYFLFYSGNNWKSSAYGVGVAVCTGPLGPCSKPLSGPILGTGSNIQGPGGASVFVDGTGSFWIAFHAWSPGAVGFPNNRSLYLRRLAMTGATPIVQP